MENKEGTLVEEPIGRRTRSGKTTNTPKPASRKTRKKVMLVEVEVSDDEELNTSKSLEEKPEDSEAVLRPENEDNAVLSSDKSKDMPLIEEKEHNEVFNSNEVSENSNILVENGQDNIQVCTVIESDMFVCEFDNGEAVANVVFEEPAKIELENEILTEEISEDVGTTEICELTDDVVMEQLKTDETVSEPIISEPTIDEPIISEPTIEESITSEVTIDEPIISEPTIEEPIISERTIEVPIISEPTIEVPIISESTIEEPIISEPTIEEPVTSEPMDPKPNISEPIISELTISEPIISESITSELITSEPIISEPASEPMIVEAIISEPMEVDQDTVTMTEESQVETVQCEENNDVKSESESSPKLEEGKEETDIQKEGTTKDMITLQSADPDAENISEDELPTVQVAKVPETEEVSDEELPGPKRAELPADTEVVSEDELPAVKKEGSTKRKIAEGDYDPGSPTSESEASAKKPFLDPDVEKEKEKAEKPKKLPELDKYWKAVNDDPTDFTGWTYLLQYVDQENDMEAAREAYDAFLSHYPYCYGYWRKYADYEKRKGNKKKCEEVFERGLKAIPLSVDLWIHYLTYVRTTKPEDEDFVRSQFERALAACGLEFRSDRLWDSYIKWETDAKRLQQVTVIYDRLLATPTQGYTTHFENFQEHVSTNPPNRILEVDEFLAIRKEVKHMLKHEGTSDAADKPDVPPGEDSEEVSSDEETKAIRERIISIRRKIHKNTVSAVTGRWNFEEGIKRPYFHVKPLERCQLKNWQEYLDYEIEHGDQTRIIVLFERCLIACALYEEFWLRFVHYLEGLKDPELHPKIKDVYERACTIHHIKKPNLHLQWAMFEESIKNYNKAAEILANIEKSVPNLLQIANRRINLERRREDFEKCSQLYEQYILNSKNKIISTNLAIKYARFCHRILKNVDKALEVLNTALGKDSNNPRLYLQLIDTTMQKDAACEKEVIQLIDAFLEKDSVDIEQKVLFAQRKLEFLEDFGSDILCVQAAYEEYQKYVKQNKENKKKETKSDAITKKDKNPPLPSSQASTYGNYGSYGNSSSAGPYQYSGSQQGQYNYSQYGQSDQYQYGNWQYPQGSYSGYNQWSGYSGGYGY